MPFGYKTAKPRDLTATVHDAAVQRKSMLLSGEIWWVRVLRLCYGKYQEETGLSTLGAPNGCDRMRANQQQSRLSSRSTQLSNYLGSHQKSADTILAKRSP